jgi:hypothetical protein
MNEVVEKYMKVWYTVKCMNEFLDGMRIDDSENVVFLPDSESSFEVDGEEYYLTVYFGIKGTKVFLNVSEEKDDTFPESFLVGDDIPPMRLSTEVERKIEELKNG